MKKSLRLISLLLSAILLISAMNIGAFAETTTKLSHTVFSGEKKLDGWYPAFITQYIQPQEMESFLKAIQKKGATIEITYSGSANVSLLLQSYTINDNGHYTWATYDDGKLLSSGSKKVISFSASGLINAYTSTKHEDDGSNLSLSKVLNFGVGGEGNTVYSIIVKWSESGVPGINFDPSVTYQTMDGWGASYTWYGDWLTTVNNRETGFDYIFNDCEFNILRFRDLNKVRGYGGAWENTNYPAYKAYYDAAVKRGIDPIVIVTSWGQYDRDVDFVALTKKDNEGHTYYTLAKDKNGEYMYDKLADFCVESVKLFQKAGIPVHYFSISNETELQGVGKDEQGKDRNEIPFYLGPTENKYHCAYWKAHIAVYKAFKEAFGDDAPILTGAEIMADTEHIISSYVDPLIKADPDSFGLIAHHLYGSVNTPQSYSDVYNKFGKDYKLWQTEWYNNDFIDHANKLINELNYENISAYLYWNGVWITDAANCLIQVDQWYGNPKIVRRANHYTMMHFSKFIKQGYKRIKTDSHITDSNVTAFISPDGKTLVTVILNSIGKTEKLKLKVDGYKIKSGKVYTSTFNSTKNPDNSNSYTDDITKNEYFVKSSMKSTSVSFENNTLTTIVMNIEPVEKAK